MLPDSPRVEGVFDAIDLASWRERVSSDLGGAEAYARKLVRTTFEGLSVESIAVAPDEALGLAEPGQAPFVRGATAQGGWQICERLERGDSKLAEIAVQGGADALWVKVGSIGEARAFLGDDRGQTPIAFDAGVSGVEVAGALLEEGDWAGPLDADPLGVAASTGRAVSSVSEDIARLAGRFAALSSERPPGLWLVDTTPYHDAGASRAQELGAALAAGLAYLRAGEAAGAPLDQVAGSLRFRLRATPELWDTVAAHRALRGCWSELLMACGLDPLPAQIHTVTSSRILSVRDPWVNVLRNTLAVMGGALGGAQWITSVPFDGANGHPTPLGRRIARQTQHVLAHEARLASTVDLAGGAWSLERSTAGLAGAAWDQLQALEKLGGLEKALSSGAVQEQVSKVRAVRVERVRTRVDTRVGISNYVQLDTPTAPGPSKAPSSLAGVEVCAPLPVWRDAAVHGALRDAADRWQAAHGCAPSVAVRTLGPRKAHGGRLTWITHVLASGGVGADTAPFSAEERLSGVVVLCGSARAYDAFEGSAAAAIQRAGAERVWVVGQPSTGDEGRPHFAEGLDLVAQLEELHRDLGVSA